MFRLLKKAKLASGVVAAIRTDALRARARRLLFRDTLSRNQQVAPKHLSLKRFSARVVAV